MTGNFISEFSWLDDFRLSAITQNPPDNLFQAIDGHFEHERSVIFMIQFLGFMPVHFGDILGDLLLEMNFDFPGFPAGIANQMSGISKITTEIKIAGNLVSLIE